MRASFEGCVFDDERREVTRAGEPVPLSPKAFALLEILVRNAPRAVSKQEIHRELWPDTFVSETSLANLVVDLRAALGAAARSARIVVDEQGALREDLGSKNGTFLRGSRITRAMRLQDGDEIQLGEVI